MLDFLVHEILNFSLYCVEISHVKGTMSIGLWESNLALDLSWNERKCFGSVVLNAAWCRNMKMMINIMCGEPSIKATFKIGIGKFTYEDCAACVVPDVLAPNADKFFKRDLIFIFLREL